jgi:hypothetical protein
LFLLLFVIQTQAQQGGMWIPFIERNEWNRNEESRHENVDKDIYDVNQSSMKDAVPHFNGGCTWRVSPKAYCLPITTVVILKFNRILQLRKII